jgi:hypothetical protein
VRTGFWWGDLGKGDHLENLGVDEIDLPKVEGRWQALVNMVMNLRVP